MVTESVTGIEYLGHAGFIVEHARRRVLIDPWFFPAFLGSWFPFPDNRFLLNRVKNGGFDYLYVSHMHEDHFDKKLLEMLDKNVSIVCPDFRSKAIYKRFRSLGFERVHVLGHKQALELAPGFRVTMFLDTSHKEDSALLLDLDGYRFFDMNDCNPPLSELPQGIDLLAAQYSGAMWYPNCYDYPAHVMREKVERVRTDLLDTLVLKTSVTKANVYIPSAGPACFIDPTLMHYNDRDLTIFPIWENVSEAFAGACPDTEVLRILPGDKIFIKDGRLTTEAYAGLRLSEDLDSYSQQRQDEWGQFWSGQVKPVSSKEIAAYFATLQRRNKHLMRDFSKCFRLIADGRAWEVRLGELAEGFVIEGEEPYEHEYSLVMSSRVLREILDGRVGWEEALLSMRIRLQRDPDVFDSTFMGLLRYGHEPVQTLQMMRERSSEEMIVMEGLRVQRFCPHAGEDLKHARICNGVIECPRHHWKWDARTGDCVQGGTLKLRVEA